MTARTAMITLVLACLPFTGIENGGSPLSDERARALAVETVAKATGISKAELNTKRLEDLEDELFSAQIKVQGQIKRGAYFYRVENGGYQITADRVTYRPPSVQSWYVAVSTTDGETFGLYGFEAADVGFHGLVSRIPIDILNPSQAQTFASFYLEVVFQKRATVIYDELRLRHEVEKHFVGYAGSNEPITRKEQRFREWWNSFRAKGVGSLEPSTKADDHGRFRVESRILEMTVGRSPELWEWSLEVQEDGVCRVLGKRQLFPRATRSLRVPQKSP